MVGHVGSQRTTFIVLNLERHQAVQFAPTPRRTTHQLFGGVLALIFRLSRGYDGVLHEYIVDAELAVRIVLALVEVFGS